MIAEPDRDGWILCRQHSASISIKATEVVHTRGFINTGAPLIAFAMAHLGDIDVAPIGAASWVVVVAADSMRRDDTRQRHNQCNQKFNLRAHIVDRLILT